MRRRDVRDRVHRRRGSAVRDRLREVVGGASAHRLDRGRHIAVRGRDDHRQLGVVLVELAQQRHAVHHRHPQVGDDDLGWSFGGDRERGLAILGGVDRVAGEAEQLLEAAARAGLVVDHEDPRAGHARPRGRRQSPPP